MTSLWSENLELPHYPRLEGARRTDVLVIGGGMAGLLCAHALRQAGVDCVIAEAARLCGGATQNTTAKITVQHGLIYADLMKKFGPEKARMYLHANQAALERYRSLCQTIDCDFEEKDAYVYSLRDRRRLDRELEALQKLDCPASFAGSLPLPLPAAGAVRLGGQAQFHPLKFASAIAGGLNVYEHTAVRELRGRTAVTDRGSITAEKIIVATHFPFLNRHGSYFLKLYQHRSYVLALENAPDVRGMYVDEAQNGMSFRNSGRFLLLGGGDHRTGKQGGNWQELRAFADGCYPDAQERFRWAAQDCMSLDSVPYIGQYAASTPDLYVATGFNKWGMTSSMAAALLLCDLVRGIEPADAPVFSPSRTMLRPKLLGNAASAALNLLTPTTPRCPHMGCALKWNAAEHSWDCPCHGSRFDRRGNLIDNPATGDLKHPG